MKHWCLAPFVKALEEDPRWEFWPLENRKALILAQQHSISTHEEAYEFHMWLDSLLKKERDEKIDKFGDYHKIVNSFTSSLAPHGGGNDTDFTVDDDPESAALIRVS